MVHRLTRLLLLLPACCSGVRDEDDDAPRAPGQGFDLYVDESVARGEADLSYEEVPIPRPREVADWIAALRRVPESGAADVTEAIDVALRFTLLAYQRDDQEENQTLLLCERGKKCAAPDVVDVVELQLHAAECSDHAPVFALGAAIGAAGGKKTKVCSDGAHLVAYLYKVGTDKVGVVMSYKGSTSGQDWYQNFQVHGTKMTLDGKVTDVHKGFLDYKRSLDESLKKFDMGPLQKVLDAWRPSCAPEEVCSAKNFYEWLRLRNAWEWCVFVGHSLGGAMASLAAADLGAHHGGVGVYLVNAGAPTAGAANFAEALTKAARPAGGIRITNPDDKVPMVGYGLLSGGLHAGRPMMLKDPGVMQFWKKDLFWSHAYFTVPSRVFGNWTMVTFKTPHALYRPSHLSGSAKNLAWFRKLDKGKATL